MRRVAIAIVTVFLAGWMCAALCYCVTTEQAPSEVLASPRVRSTPPPLPSFCPPLSEDPVLAPPPPKPLSITDASEPYGCQMLPDYPGCRPWPPLPRCRESDATCGPEYLERSSATYGRYPRVVWQGANGESGAACYSPSAARHPTWGARATTSTCEHLMRASRTENAKSAAATGALASGGERCLAATLSKTSCSSKTAGPFRPTRYPTTTPCGAGAWSTAAPYSPSETRS